MHNYIFLCKETLIQADRGHGYHSASKSSRCHPRKTWTFQPRIQLHLLTTTQYSIRPPSVLYKQNMVKKYGFDIFHIFSLGSIFSDLYRIMFGVQCVRMYISTAMQNFDVIYILIHLVQLHSLKYKIVWKSYVWPSD